MKRTCLVAAMMSLMLAGAAGAEDLYAQGSWPSLAADRAAEKVGDSLTVLIQEASSASDSSQHASKGGVGLDGSASTSSSKPGRAALSGDYSYSVGGQHARSGRLIAQISVVVDEVLPNGDLHIAGDQLININGEKTQIHLTGRVRRADISSTNMVFSTSLADATIVYGGPGLDGKGDKRGFISRMFSRGKS